MRYVIPPIENAIEKQRKHKTAKKKMWMEKNEDFVFDDRKRFTAILIVS